MVKHQIDSYNDFVMRKMEHIIEGFNTVEIFHQYIPEQRQFRYKLLIEIINPSLSKPMIHEKDGSTKIMTPNDARLRNFTYAVPLNVDVKVTTESWDDESGRMVVDSKRINGINIGKVPLMVRSKYCVLNTSSSVDGGFDGVDECAYDVGGYFVINGNEKVVISQDRISENKTFVFSNIRGATGYSYIAEIRSVSEKRFGVPKTTCLKLAARENQFGRHIRVNLHHIKHDVPLLVLFKALGIASDKTIVDLIVGDKDEGAVFDSIGGAGAKAAITKQLIASIHEACEIKSQVEAIEYMSRYLQINGYPKEVLADKADRFAITQRVLSEEFLPHVGQDATKKALYLAYMSRKLICCFLGIWPMDDRDSYINKRVDTPGVLMANLFRQYYGKMVKDMKAMIQKDINNGPWKATGQFGNIITKVNIYKIIKSSIIESGMKYALSTGNWGIKSNNSKQGVAQVLNRMTYNATVSHLRRVNTPLEKSGKLIQPRKLHSTQFGYICPAECFDPETPILMWDGTIKVARDISVGDYLIDDNGNAVMVKSTCAGVKAMYEIVPDKRNFMSYTVTDNHILTLKVGKNPEPCNDEAEKELRYRYRLFEDGDGDADGDGGEDGDDVIDITIEKYLSLPDNVRNNLYLFKSSGINWAHKDVSLDPYILGSWLGNGGHSADKEQLDKNKGNDKTITEDSTTEDSTTDSEADSLEKSLVKYNLVNNKHIPKDYLVNDRATRLAVLAGLIDTVGYVSGNGHQIPISRGEKNCRILYDAEFLARSLGFNCHMYDTDTDTDTDTAKGTTEKVLHITGLLKPIKPTKNPPSASFMQSSFQLIKKKVQPYVGWQLDGSGRFLLGDMSISHNTPEGQSVGLVKNLAMTAFISIASTSQQVRDMLERDESMHMYGVGRRVPPSTATTTVVVNGDIIGVHNDPHVMFERIKDAKRTGVISVFSSVVWDVLAHEIRINTEGGRLLRPLVVVGCRTETRTQGSSSYTTILSAWDNMVMHGIVEYLDVEECNASMIAMRPEDLTNPENGAAKRPHYTHMEIHPSMILGALAGSIPFSDHNQAPRNTYQSCMGKQAIGVYTTNFRHRLDTMAHVLNYPQKPIVQTKISKLVNADTMPSGVNAIVAIMCMTGFNQEDSIIMNKSAIDRGLFSSTYYRTYKDQNNRNHSNGEEEFFIKPEPEKTVGMKPYNYDKLSSDGFVPENTAVDAGDVIIGKCMPQKRDSMIVYKDTSVSLKNNESGYIDRNCYSDKHFTNVNGDGYTFSKVRIRNMRMPTIGDKFSCYTPDHEVLTRDHGWVRFDALTTDHCVATLVGNAELVYQYPTEVQQYDGYKGHPMYTVKTQHVDLSVTPNHRMYVRRMALPRRGAVGIIYEQTPPYQTPLAEDIFGESRHYKRNADQWTPHQRSPEFRMGDDGETTHFMLGDTHEFKIDKWVDMVGAWYSTASNDIATLLHDLIDNDDDDDKTSDTSNIRLMAVAEYFGAREHGGENMSLPLWTMSLDRPLCTRLLERLVDGKLEAGMVFDTKSATLRDQFQQLCLHAGHVATWHLHTTDTMESTDTWRCTVAEDHEPLVNRYRNEGRETWSPSQDDKVYCCTVPKGDGVVYVRRSGLPVWCGQSKHGQKGTVGMVYRQEDMPFTKEGLVPDLIINPHAIPSRMTIAQLMECLLSKSCTMSGKYGDATPFTDITVESIAAEMENHGYDRYGNEVMYNPRTGEQINTEIFIGPTLYQRLKHMTCDKVHSRSNAGPIVLLTRQPAEGRAREGGLRIGEMEQETNIGHGIMGFLKERFMESSDNYRVHICKKCGTMANVNPDNNIYECKPCKNMTNFSEIRIPYAAKLLFQELNCMSVSTRFMTG